jgi:hypothetical protein
MKAILTALLVVAGDAISTARLREMHVHLEADTDSRAVAVATDEARPDVVAALEEVGVHVLADSGSSRTNGRPEILITVHGYSRDEAGSPGAGDLIENVEIRLCGPPAGRRAAPSAPCTPQWWRATPLERVPRGAPLPVRKQILALVAEFIAEHHFPTWPAVPPNPRHIGWW